MSYLNVFELLDKNKATASARKGTGVDNTVSGRCPKCRNPFGTAIIDVGTVYYCSACKVAMPITE